MEKERLAFNRVLGFAPEADLRPETDLACPYTRLLPSRDEVLEGLEAQRLDLLALRKGYESQEASVRAAVRAQFPKVSLGLGHAHDTSNIGSMGVGLTIALPVFDRNQGQIAIEKATREQLFDDYVSRVFEARAEVASLLADIQAVKRQIAAAENSLPALQNLAAAYERASQEGNVDIISYYDARNAAAVRQLDVLKLKETLAELGVGLELATGRYFPQRVALAPASRKPE